MANDLAAGERMTGKELEAIVKERLSKELELGTCHITRYGVQVSRVGDGAADLIVMQSLPDFEGIVPGGRQTIFDCKACSQASFDLTEYRTETGGARERQLRHMIDRAKLGAVCFFLIHWNRRQLATKTEPAVTYAFPIHPELIFWRDFYAGERKKITRQDCEWIGFEVAWNARDREHKPRPDVLAAVHTLGKLYPADFSV